jgi:hypothetical protein
LDAGLDWVFCDTDSLAVVTPEALSEADFAAKTKAVIKWFEALNPYRTPGSILKIEDANYGLDDKGEPTKELAPLFCFAISAKRYALFNLDADGRPVIRKASAHGLGQYLPPYGEKDAPADIPPPSMPLSDIGVERWQYDLWFKIIEAALAGHPDQVRLDYHAALQLPAAMRFGVSSPHLERWMARYNEVRPYPERVRPFGFMVRFQARKNSAWDEVAPDAGPQGRGRPRKRPGIKPMAPFDRDPAKAAAGAFDRATGKPIPVDQLKTYAEALQQFHLHPEDKFLNGDFLDRGRTQRRHVVATDIRLIGKESNKWEEQPILDDDFGADFGAIR